MPTIASAGKFWNFLTGRWQDLPADFETMLRKTESLFERDEDYVLHASTDETAPESKKKVPPGEAAPVSPPPTPAPPPERSAGTSTVDKPDETIRGNPDATPKPNPGAGSQPLPPMPPVVGLDADVSTRPQLPPEAALYGGSNSAPSPDRFESFFRQLQKEKGGYSDNPKDSGGETNHGVTLDIFNTYRELGKQRDKMPDDIKNLTKDEAKIIMRELFYDPLKLDQIRDEQTARHLFDAAILSGSPQATKWVQRELAEKIGSQIKDDGVMGSYTRQILNALSPSELAAINAGMAARREEFFNELVRKRPKDEDFIRGWIDRARPFGIWRPTP